MWAKELRRPRWLTSQGDTGIWQDRSKRISTFLLAACNPRLGQSAAGDDGVAWLNGLRGFAAFLVYWHHHQLFIPHGGTKLWHSFGYNGEHYFGALPFVRLFFVGGGQPAVALFFVISGYVLSYSPLSLIHARPEGVGSQLATRVGTAFARRWLRLFLPVIAVTFAFMASWHLFHIRSAALNAAAPTATFADEVVRWLSEFLHGSYVFNDRPFAGSDYNPHMWSIAVEYRGSLLVYVYVLAVFALGYSPSERFWAALVTFFYFHFVVNGHYYAGFIAGMAIGDLTITSENDPAQLPKIFRGRFVRKHTWIYYVILLAGIYLVSIPTLNNVKELPAEPGWSLLSHLVPSATSNPTWFFLIFGAAFLVTSIPHIRWLKRLFESAPAQYLGKISYGLYLVHGPLIWTVGDRLYAAVGAPNFAASERIPDWIDCFPLPSNGPLGMEINTMVPHVVLLPLTLWMAGIVTKVVDVPSVRLSKYLFGQKKRMVDKERNGSWEMEGMLAQADGRLLR